MRKNLILFIALAALLISGCGKSKELVIRHGVTIKIELNPYKTIKFYQDGKYIDEYHEDQLSDTARGSFVTNNDKIHEPDISKNQSADVVENALWQAYAAPGFKNSAEQIYAFRFFNLSPNGNVVSQTFIFYDRWMRRIVGTVQADPIIRAFDPKAVSMRHPIIDLNHDSLYTAADTLIDVAGTWTPPQALGNIEQYFNDGECKLAPSLDTSFSLVVSRYVANAVGERYAYSDEVAVKKMSLLDANNDMVIDWADDINLDGYINEADYVAARYLRTNLYARYGSSFSAPQLNVNDVLFGINSIFGTFRSNIVKASPRDMGFKLKSNEQFSSSHKILDYNVHKEETKSTKTSPSGPILGSGLGVGLGLLLTSNPLGWILGGMLGAGIGSMPSTTTTTRYDTTYKELTVNYYQYTGEVDELVNVAVFTDTETGYKVFIFDASGSITETKTRTIIKQYSDGRLNPVSDDQIGQTWATRVDHQTSGRVSVYDPMRRTQCNFDNDKFLAIFDKEFIGNENQETDLAKVKSLIEPYVKAKDNIINVRLWQLTQIRNAMRKFDPKGSFENQEKVILAMKRG